MILDSVSYQLDVAGQTIKKVAGDSSAVKKVLQIGSKIFEAFDLYFVREIGNQRIVRVMKDAERLLEFYGTYNNIMFWLNPFLKQPSEKAITQQKTRPMIQLIYKACFTIVDLGNNIVTLKKWNILDLSHFAARIGRRSPVAMFAVNLGISVCLKVVASAGLILVVGHAASRSIHYGIKYSRSEGQMKKETYQELRNALLDLFSAGSDLAGTAAPLLFTLNPSLFVAISLFSKSTGLVCILVR